MRELVGHARFKYSETLCGKVRSMNYYIPKKRDRVYILARQFVKIHFYHLWIIFFGFELCLYAVCSYIARQKFDSIRKKINCIKDDKSIYFA